MTKKMSTTQKSVPAGIALPFKTLKMLKKIAVKNNNSTSRQARVWIEQAIQATEQNAEQEII